MTTEADTKDMVDLLTADAREMREERRYRPVRIDWERMLPVGVLRGLRLIQLRLDEGGHDWREGASIADAAAARAWLDDVAGEVLR